MDLVNVFEVRPLVMKTVPFFLRGTFKTALKASLQEIRRGQHEHDDTAEIREVEIVLLTPKDFVAQTSKRWIGPKGAVARTSRQVFARTVGHVIGNIPRVVHSRSSSELQTNRLRMPLPLSVRHCSCGCILDPSGHHRAACSTVGVLSRRGFAVENAVAQICQEGGARVSTNIFVRDLDLEVAHVSTDGRRLEVVAEGLFLFGGCQLALDATLVSALHGNGIHRRNADKADGIVLREARRHKERTYPELQGRNGRVRMVVIAGEVGGRWSEETKASLWALACEKSRSEARVLRKSVRAAWYRRWCCLLACAAAKAVALSLLERRGVPGVGDDPPTTHEVVAATFREAWFSLFWIDLTVHISSIVKKKKTGQ